MQLCYNSSITFRRQDIVEEAERNVKFLAEMHVKQKDLVFLSSSL